MKTFVLAEWVVSSFSSPSPSASWTVAAGIILLASSPPSSGATASASGVPSRVENSDGVGAGDAPILPATIFGDSVEDDAGSASPSSEDFGGGDVPNTNPTGLPMLPLGGLPKPPKGLGLLPEPEPKAPLFPNGLGGAIASRAPNGLIGFDAFDFGFSPSFTSVDGGEPNKNEGTEVGVDEVPPKRVELGGLALDEPNDRVADDDPKEELLKLKLGFGFDVEAVELPEDGVDVVGDEGNEKGVCEDALNPEKLAWGTGMPGDGFGVALASGDDIDPKLVVGLTVSVRVLLSNSFLISPRNFR